MPCAILGIIALLAVFVGLAIPALGDGRPPGDEALLRLVQGAEAPGLDAVLTVANSMGGRFVMIPLGLALVIIHGRRPRRAMVLACYGMVLMLIWPRLGRRSSRCAFAGGLITLILLVDLARIHFGAHWPSDVAGGWALGGAWCLLARNIVRQIG